MRGWNVSREVAVVPANHNRVDPRYLAFWIGSIASQRWLTGAQKGVAYTGINIEDLRALPVSTPTLGEQREIVRRVESLFALADQLEARYATARTHTDRLNPALLAKAFRGELVK
jgi:type I restriction enzyme S subunit